MVLQNLELGDDFLSGIAKRGEPGPFLGDNGFRRFLCKGAGQEFFEPFDLCFCIGQVFFQTGSLFTRVHNPSQRQVYLHCADNQGNMSFRLRLENGGEGDRSRIQPGEMRQAGDFCFKQVEMVPGDDDRRDALPGFEVFFCARRLRIPRTTSLIKSNWFIFSISQPSFERGSGQGATIRAAGQPPLGPKAAV